MPVDERVSNLEKYHLELATVVWGDNRTRDNGIRSVVRDLEEEQLMQSAKINLLDSKIKHYVDVERKNTCHGLVALDKHVEKHFIDLEETVQVKVAKINRGSASWVQFLQLAGILAVAIMTLVKK